MDDPSLPTALRRLLARGLLPHASLLVGGRPEQHQTATQSIAASVGIAAADCLFVSAAPTIEELRQLVGRIHLRPFHSGLSLLALAQFDRWSEECATLLLKTLEEPPAHARILLFAASDGDILRTILSRVARFRLPTPLDVAPTDLPDATLPLAEQFAWSKAQAAADTPTVATLRALVGSARSLQTGARLLAYASAVGTHPVNARLALDTALLIRRHSEVPS